MRLIRNSVRGGDCTSLAQVAGKIREIEKSSGEYTVIVDFGDHFGGTDPFNSFTHYISFYVKENDKKGAKVLDISETVTETKKGQYEYSFQTDADTVYISHYTYYQEGMDVGIVEGNETTLTGLKQHKIIKIIGDMTATGAISYAD